MKRRSALFSSCIALGLMVGASVTARAASDTGTQTVKSYLVSQVTKMNGSAHDFVANAAAYNQIIQANGGDYNKAAINNGPELLSLVAKMQSDYKGLHMSGYETVEGIAAGVKELVKYDIYFDSGVPASQASTDNPSAPINLLTASGEVIDENNGNTQPGIKALLDRGAPMDELTAGYERTLKNLDECVALLKVSVSPATIGFTAFTIVAREGLEAIVILAALLAGLRGDENAHIRRGIVRGAILGVAASGVTFWLSQTLVHSLIRYGEKLEAIVSVFAVIILLIVTNWVFHKMYWVGWNAKLRDLSKSARAVQSTPFWEVSALLGVGFLIVYREGFETTIFMQSLVLEGSGTPVLMGVLAGFVFIGTIGMLIMFFGAKLPYRKLLIVTGVLVVSIMVTFLGSAVRLFQTVSWLPVHPIPGLDLPNWVGVWLGIYPSWEGVLIPPLALVYVGGAWLYTKMSTKSAQEKYPATPQLVSAKRSTSKKPVSV